MAGKGYDHVIRMENIRMSFGAVLALDDVSLAVDYLEISPEVNQVRRWRCRS